MLTHYPYAPRTLLFGLLFLLAAPLAAQDDDPDATLYLRGWYQLELSIDVPLEAYAHTHNPLDRYQTPADNYWRAQYRNTGEYTSAYFSAACHYTFGHHWSGGLRTGYRTVWGTNKGKTQAYPDQYYRAHDLTLMASLRYSFPMMHRRAQIYFGAAVGPCAHLHSDYGVSGFRLDLKTAGEATLFGFRYGRKLYAFSELNVGNYNGTCLRFGVGKKL